MATMSKTICKDCSHLDQATITRLSNRWMCNASWRHSTDVVTGKKQSEDSWPYCVRLNSGSCPHFKDKYAVLVETEPVETEPVEPVEPVSWWSRTFTKKFWVDVTINTIGDLLFVGILYLWIKSHGGITTW